MNRNLVGSIYGRSSINIAHFVVIRYQTCPPQAILFSDWSISKKVFSSGTAWPNEPNLGRRHPLKVLYKDFSFSSNLLANMAATCLITDHNEMSNIYRGPSIDTSNQVSVHLAKRFQRRRFIVIGRSFRPDPLINLAAIGNSCF
jgi:hypothetical protein